MVRILGEVRPARKLGECGSTNQILFLTAFTDDFESNWEIPDPFNPTSILFEDFESFFLDSPFDPPTITEDFENFFLENPFDPPFFTEDFENGGW